MIIAIGNYLGVASISTVPSSTWILENGLWRDVGVWDDNSNWMD